MTSLILNQLIGHARRRPNAPAAVEVADGRIGRTITWSQLFHAAARLGRLIRKTQPSPATVVISCGNRIEFPVALLGALLADAQAFPVSPDLTARELQAAARESAVSMLIGDAATTEKLGDGSVHWLPLKELIGPDDGWPGDNERAAIRGAGGLLLQSSGTTGLPKIVRRDIPALDAVATNCIAALALGESDRMLVALPLHHSYGLEHGVFSCVAAGCTLELHRGFDLASVCAALAGGQVTHMPGVPFMFDMLAQRGSVRCGPSVRALYSAGAPLPRSVADSFERASGLRLGQIYGATEFGSVTFNDPCGPGYDPTCAGVALGGVRLRVVDEAGLPLPAGREGELSVAAPSMFSEYLDEVRPSIVDGWFLTGDLGRLDADGRLSITGRLKLLIEVGGNKVNPIEVETVLTQHPEVREVVVVPIQVTQTLNRLKAIVLLQPRGTIDGEGLRRWAQERLSAYKVPRVFEIRPTLPRTPTGKVLRQALQWS